MLKAMMVIAFRLFQSPCDFKLFSFCICIDSWCLLDHIKISWFLQFVSYRDVLDEAELNVSEVLWHL